MPLIIQTYARQHMVVTCIWCLTQRHLAATMLSDISIFHTIRTGVYVCGIGSQIAVHLTTAKLYSVSAWEIMKGVGVVQNFSVKLSWLSTNLNFFSLLLL